MGNRMGTLAFDQAALCHPSPVLLTPRPAVSVSAVDCFHSTSEQQTSERRRAGQGALGAEIPSQPAVTDYFNKTGHCPVCSPVCVWGAHNGVLTSLILVSHPRAPSPPSFRELGVGGERDESGWRRVVKAASPGSAWGQPGSHRSLSV